MKTLEDLRNDLDALTSDEFCDYFTPFSYYNDSLDEAINTDVLDQSYSKDELERLYDWLCDNKDEIEQIFYDRTMDVVSDQDIDDEDIDVIGFEWVNVVYYFLTGVLGHHYYNSRCREDEILPLDERMAKIEADKFNF